MPFDSRSASPLLKGVVAFAFTLAALQAVLGFLVEEPISWVRAGVVSLFIGAAVFDRARGNGRSTPQRFLDRQPRRVRVVLHFAFGVLLLWAIPLVLALDPLPWAVTLGTAALLVVHTELARLDERQREAGRPARWSREDRLMLGLSAVALVVYAVALTRWGLPTSAREWISMAFVFAFPVGMLLWVFFHPRKGPDRPDHSPHHT